MAEALIRFRFTVEEMAYLKEICLADATASKAMANCTDGMLSLTRSQSEHFRDHLSITLAQVGFDENYDLTKEGEMIELLIDKLFVY